MLKKENRIRLKNDFDRAFKHGNSLYSKKIGLKVSNNDLGLSRFGVVVSTKVSKKAVERNRIKRIIRSYIQDNLEQIKSGLDVIIITLPALNNYQKDDLKQEIQDLFLKSGVLIS